MKHRRILSGFLATLFVLLSARVNATAPFAVLPEADAAGLFYCYTKSLLRGYAAS